MRIDRIKLISLLAERNIRQYELADISGASRATVNSICCGRSCKEATARRIADALGVELKTILES